MNLFLFCIFLCVCARARVQMNTSMTILQYSDNHHHCVQMNIVTMETDNITLFGAPF